MSCKSLQQSTQLLRERLEKSAAAKIAPAQPKAERPVDAPDVEPASSLSETASLPPGPESLPPGPHPLPLGPESLPPGPDPLPSRKNPALQPAAIGAQTDSSEQRKSHRKSTRLAGVICNSGSRTPINCVIKDMSASGAYVVVERCGGSAFSGTPQIGVKFTLYLTYDRMAVPCALQWRKGEAVGASFLSAPTFY